MTTHVPRDSESSRINANQFLYSFISAVQVGWCRDFLYPLFLFFGWKRSRSKRPRVASQYNYRFRKRWGRGFASFHDFPVSSVQAIYRLRRVEYVLIWVLLSLSFSLLLFWRREAYLVGKGTIWYEILNLRRGRSCLTDAPLISSNCDGNGGMVLVVWIQYHAMLSLFHSLTCKKTNGVERTRLLAYIVLKQSGDTRPHHKEGKLKKLERLHAPLLLGCRSTH